MKVIFSIVVITIIARYWLSGHYDYKRHSVSHVRHTTGFKRPVPQVVLQAGGECIFMHGILVKFPISSLRLVAVRSRIRYSLQPCTQKFHTSSATMGKLYAISDIHISYKFNHEAIHLLEPHPEDTLILAGDIGEKLEHLHTAFKLTTKLFKQVFWVPGNHELYTLPQAHDVAHQDNALSPTSPASAQVPEPENARGETKYLECVKVANEYGVITPEDMYVTWHSDNSENAVKALICPMFLLYDYSFRPPEVSREQALDWAAEHNIRATDESLLHPDPYESRDAWCNSLIARTEEKLQMALAKKDKDTKVVLINHWPLRQDLVTIPSIPRFSLWCGTKQTEDWHTRFGADVVITGHLHVRRTDWIDGVRFEEVSLGYPKQWEGARERGKGVNDLLREILPGPYENVEKKIDDHLGERRTIWRRNG